MPHMIVINVKQVVENRITFFPIIFFQLEKPYLK